MSRQDVRQGRDTVIYGQTNKFQSNRDSDIGNMTNNPIRLIVTNCQRKQKTMPREAQGNRLTIRNSSGIITLQPS